jgi:hypothetical protein
MDLLEKMRDLHIAKNAGYAGDSVDPWANFRMSEAFGVPAFKGCLIRMSDKYIRVTNLIKNPANEQVGENIKDTLFDLAAYALIAVCLMEEADGIQKQQDISIQNMATETANALPRTGRFIERVRETE